MRYFLGIDVGSSKTHALIVDENGQCVGFGKAGGGNHQGVGYEGTHRVMQTSFDEALKNFRRRQDSDRWSRLRRGGIRFSVR